MRSESAYVAGLRDGRAVYLDGELANEKNAAAQATLGGDIAALCASFRCLGEC